MTLVGQRHDHRLGWRAIPRAQWEILEARLKVLDNNWFAHPSSCSERPNRVHVVQVDRLRCHWMFSSDTDSSNQMCFAVTSFNEID
jgi:hypothetical protein